MTRLLIPLCLAVALAACPAADTRKESAPPEAATRSPGKPLHPVQVRAVVDDPVTAGAETVARVMVSSVRPAHAVEVVLQPDPAMLVSETRFERRGTLSRDVPVSFAFRVRPTGEPRPVRALVRVTTADGRVMTREVELSFQPGKDDAAQRKPHAVTVEDVEPRAEDVVLPAEQEIRRDSKK